MIGKITGAILLALGGGYLCVEQNARGRKEIRLLYELSAALESMEGMIRWEKATLPSAIGRQCGRELCGEFFEEILNLVESGIALQKAWIDTFLQVKTMEDILCRLEFSGDEIHLTGQLQLAANQLRKRAEQQNAGRAEREKLHIVVCASAVGLITILLF